jgi:hypothetical protein
MGRLDEAISEFETVLQTDPQHEPAAQALARVKALAPVE